VTLAVDTTSIAAAGLPPFYPWPTVPGWKCAMCGAFVFQGQVHLCRPRPAFHPAVCAHGIPFDRSCALCGRRR
jgi:hypothetical protein